MSFSETYHDTALLKRIAAGEWAAYDELVRQYSSRLLFYLMPLTRYDQSRAEDILQDVFLAVWEKRESLLFIRSIEQYLFRMTKNRFLDLLRKEQSRLRLIDRYQETGELNTAASPYEQVLYAEYSAQAAKAISQLSEKLRIVFLLSTQHDLSVGEIANALNLPKETVKKRLYLAGNFIRSYLKKHGEWLLLLLVYFF
ncbi:MAG TPA: sigma-70 family RNA polymerase sigma factor [Chitinophaga sp.]|uniref:RNA polymerase sigma factor n=1 Tax=Chitinophaga sp. TaxID=1869181 RepID=UPI002DBF1F87|nr:sigma-70 family RNA polymerase sigma factor [Chitinophaga sp.]HEU4553879.1 sigma-70 family RNA polymerase sigma factor [Chitinophaga sp.]